MKKLMVALMVLAVAAVAQAELVATWTAPVGGIDLSTSGSTLGATVSGYGFTMVSGSGFTTGGSVAGNTIAVSDARAANAAAAYAAGDYVYFTWDTAYSLSLNSITGRYTRSAGGAQSAQWGTIIGATWSSIGTEITAVPTTTSGLTPTTTTFTGVDGLTSGQLALAVYGGTSSGQAQWFRFDSRPTTAVNLALTIDGEMTPIPEPATMGLLGLGALALVLRRRIRK